MDAIKNIIINLSSKFDALAQPIWDKVEAFFSKGYFVVYALITLVLIFLVIPGLVVMLKKAGKFFIFLLFLVGVVFALWYFIVLPTL